MIYTLAIYNAIDGETVIPLIGFTQRKNIDAGGQLKTALTLSVPAGYNDTLYARSTDEFRIYQDAELLFAGDLISIGQEKTASILSLESAIAAPAPVTIGLVAGQAVFVSEGYSRLRIPANMAINPGDTVTVDTMTLIAAKTTTRISLTEAFTEVSDNAAG